MTKVVLADTQSGYNLSKINQNFDTIESELNDKVLYRDNPTGEPNQMEDVLDMNNNRIINLPAPSNPNDAARLADIPTEPVPIGTTTALLTTFSPASNIASTNVQAAIEEVNNDLRNDLASSASASVGTGMIGQKRSDTGTVAKTLRQWINYQPLSFGSDFGADDGGVTNVASLLQAALDAVEARGGGQLVIPWPAVSYNLGTTTILIPTNTELYVQGTPNIVSGGQPFTYSGTDAAFATKFGETDQVNNRGIAVINAGVNLTGVGATGFRFRRIRDLYLQCCVVRITANSQTGFRFMGERGGGTYAGVFDTVGIRLASYANSTSLTGVKHYVLSGTDGDGQCNSNSFYGLRAGGVGKCLEVGPSLNNSWYNLSMEAPGQTEDFIHFLAAASKNTVYDLYAGDAPSGYTGKIMRCDNGSPGATENRLIRYNAGQNVDDYDLSLGAVANNNEAISAAGVRYVSGTGAIADAIGVQGETYSRIEMDPDEIRFGNGTSAPVRAWPGDEVENNIYSSALGTLTPNILTGRSKFVRFDAGASGTLTVAAPTNAHASGGDAMEFFIYNNSGVSINLSWNAAYVPVASFPTSIANGVRLHVSVRNVATNWWYR